jgi:hypothetical protein
MLRSDDSSDRTPFQRLADLKWRDVGFGVIHSPTHVRIDREKHIAHEHFSGIWLTNFDGCKREVVQGGLPLRTAGKVYFTA